MNNLRKNAPEIYVFCPITEEGFMFYDMSPSGPVAELTGFLPEGKFWYLHDEMVQWDEKINGKKNNDVLVSDDTPLIVDSRYIRYVDSTSRVYTIMVSPEVFLDLLHQLQEPTMSTDGRYKILDFHGKIRRLSFINNQYNNTDLNKYDDLYYDNYDMLVGNMTDDDIKGRRNK